MATSDQRITKSVRVLTTDLDGQSTFTDVLTTRSPADDAKESALFPVVTTAMPSALRDPIFKTDSSAAEDFVMELEDEFRYRTYPSWLAQLPETAQTYFITRWMTAVLDRTDLLGSSSVTVTALVLTKGSGSVTSTVAGSATLARSQSWHYMSVLTEHLPAAVQILTNGGSPDFASAVYKQFTSGTAPTWFQAMPTDAQSYVVLDFLPAWLREPMTLDWLALASPAARPTGTTAPTGVTGPTSTTGPTLISISPTSAIDRASSKRDVVVVAILIPLVALAIALGFAIWFFRYRRKRRARSLASSLPPLDPEQAVRRWSETTFSTAVSPQSPQNQHSFLPPLVMTESHARGSTALRRALSESDLGQVTSPDLKGQDLEGVETQSDRAELEARTTPLTKC